MPLPTEERQKVETPIEPQEPGIDNQRLSERSRYTQIGYQKIQEKEYLQAESMFRAALSTFKESEEESESFALANCRLGKVCCIQKKYDDSEIAFLRAVTCFLRIGVCNQNLAAAQETLAEIFYLQNRYAEAEKTFKYVLVLCDSSWKKLDQVGFHLGLALSSQEKYEEAEIVLKRTVKNYSKGKKDELLGKLHLNLGFSLAAQEKYEEALDAFLSAEKTYLEVGADNIRMGNAKYNQGVALWELGENVAAQEAVMCALRFYKKGGAGDMRILEVEASLRWVQSTLMQSTANNGKRIRGS